MLKIQVVKKEVQLESNTILLQYYKDHYKLIVLPDVEPNSDPTFIYTFFNTTFKIEGATQIRCLSDIQEIDGYTYQILLIVSNNSLFIVTLCSYHNRHDALRNCDATYKILTRVEQCYLNNDNTEDVKVYTPKLQLVRKKGFHYLISNPYDSEEHIGATMLVRFNIHGAKKYVVPDNSKIVFDNSFHDNFVKYVITSTSIFNFETFTNHDLGDLFARFNLDYTQLFFKISYIGEKELLFVSKDYVDFSELKNNNNVLISHSTYAIGFLYDLTSGKMVLPTCNDCPWSKFFLYDDEFPHIIKETFDDGTFEFKVLRYQDSDDSFDTIISEVKPTVVSYKYLAKNDTEENTFVRLVFLKKKTDSHQMKSDSLTDKNIMLAFNENHEIICFDDYVELEAVNFANKNATYDVSSQTNTNIFHLTGNDSIILKSCKGEFGEFILMFLNEPIKINYLLSFFGYQRAVLGFNFNGTTEPVYQNSKFLLLKARMNDYDNADFVINLQNHKLYTFDEFITLINTSN